MGSKKNINTALQALAKISARKIVTEIEARLADFGRGIFILQRG
jgi:hypothetical protein